MITGIVYQYINGMGTSTDTDTSTSLPARVIVRP